MSRIDFFSAGKSAVEIAKTNRDPKNVTTMTIM
jgi:hypothetical protein